MAIKELKTIKFPGLTDIYTVENKVDREELETVITELGNVEDIATQALTASNGKCRIFFTSSTPVQNVTENDIWFNPNEDNALYKYNGTSWEKEELGADAIADLSITNAKIADGTISNAKIGNLDAGKITSGTINAARINVADLISAGGIAITSQIPTSVAELSDASDYATTTYADEKADDAQAAAEAAAQTYADGAAAAAQAAAEQTAQNYTDGEIATAKSYSDNILIEAQTYADASAGGAQAAAQTYADGAAAAAQAAAEQTASADATTKANAASRQATYYISQISGYDGICVHEQDDLHNFVNIDPIAGNIKIISEDSVVAILGEIITLGGSDASHIEIDNNSLDIIYDNTIVAHFGYDNTVSQGMESENKYISIGERLDINDIDTFSSSTQYYHNSCVLYTDQGSTDVYAFKENHQGAWDWSKVIHVGNADLIIGSDSVAEGTYTIAAEYTAHAEGMNSISTGPASHAEGQYTIAASDGAHAEGVYTRASINQGAHAEGAFSSAIGEGAHAEGFSTQANGDASHSSGEGTIARRKSQTVIGEYNVEDITNQSSPQSDYNSKGNYVFIVGNGTDDNTRSNAATIDWSGNLVLAGTSSQSSDKRLKDHKEYLVDNNKAIEFISNLKPAYYTKDNENHIGFYAQDVEEIDKWGCMVGEMNGYKTLNYIEIIAPLVSYCQKLEQRIVELESKLNNK